MAVESFIPLSESKMTIEKSVKPKLSTKELTKIEKPGNTQEREEKPQKEKTKKSKPKASAKEESPNRDSILIITEKPQAALKIASALSSSSRKFSENNVPYYELERNNKKIVVASAVGHLLNLTYVKGQTGWPIFNLQWVPSYESKTAKFTKNYYTLLKKLGRKAKEVIIATDYDIEGELIGWNVLRFIIGEKDAKRMKYSTLTKPELEKSYENPMKTLDWGQAFAGETRHKIDWLYGINLSRALMSAIKQAGSFKILSIGRVQGPALKIIVDRDKEIENFKSQPYWQVFATTKNTELKHVKDIFKKEELEDFKNIKSGTAETTEKNEEYPPPHPFDLTTLQRESYSNLKLSPSRTLQLAQSLYLDGIISYPRTSSQKIPKEIEPKKIIEKLSKKFQETKLAVRENPIEGEKSDPAHPCFTEDTEIKLKNRNISFKELTRDIIKWNYDPNKRSFFSEINIKDVTSYNHKESSLVYSKAYKIWKTPIKEEIINFTELNLKTTKNHQIYATTKEGVGYTIANNLKVGDYIFRKREIENKIYNLNLKEKDILLAYSKKNKEQIIKKANTQIYKNYLALKEIINKITLNKSIKLAKIAGFCIGDGHISFKSPSKNRENYPCTTFVGRTEDMQKLKKDIESLGFSSYIQNVRNNEDYKFLSSKNSLFGRLLIAIGCPTGDKVSNSFDVPKWIKNSQDSIKSAFIGGLFSAELSKTRIHTKNPRDIRPYTFAQHKIKDMKKPFIKYLLSLKRILKSFKIETSKIKIKEAIIRKKDNKKTIKGIIDIKNNRKNLINFLSIIDFGYCLYKEETYRKALAYLLCKDRAIDYKISLRKESKKLHYKGLSFKEISKILNISQYTIKGWLYYLKALKEKHISINDIPKYKEFKSEVPKNCIPIKIKKMRINKFEGFVYDLEIQNTHTFFPQGILVHNCIYPTGEFKSLSDEEEKLYALIVKRFISCFSPNAQGISKRIQLISDNNKKFTSNGLTITDKGWTQVYPTTFEEKQIPTINGIVEVDKIRFEEKETQPPKRYTPASLITLLEKKNLGTKATRSAIVDILFNRGYLDGKSIEATPLGKKLIEALEKYSPIIIDENLTRDVEEKMEEILNSKSGWQEKEDKTIQQVERLITDISKEFKAHEISIGNQILSGITDLREQQKENSTIMQCPQCKTGNLQIRYSKKTRRSFVGCSNYPNCTATYPLPPNAMIKKTDKVSERNLPILVALRKGKRPWEFEFNPNWKAENQQKSKEENQ